jgi:hypothetical protein
VGTVKREGEILVKRDNVEILEFGLDNQLQGLPGGWEDGKGMRRVARLGLV